MGSPRWNFDRACVALWKDAHGRLLVFLICFVFLDDREFLDDRQFFQSDMAGHDT
jgi:hypothetical protein